MDLALAAFILQNFAHLLQTRFLLSDLLLDIFQETDCPTVIVPFAACMTNGDVDRHVYDIVPHMQPFSYGRNLDVLSATDNALHRFLLR
jgi:hypothetical protein